MFLKQPISILEWFLKDHVTEDWSNDAEIQIYNWRVNYILKYIQIENIYFKQQTILRKI